MLSYNHKLIFSCQNQNNLVPLCIIVEARGGAGLLAPLLPILLHYTRVFFFDRNQPDKIIHYFCIQGTNDTCLFSMDGHDEPNNAS
jgi:hypothetical protein